MEWQPIETAPKDGRNIIVASINVRSPFVDVAHWDKDKNLWRAGLRSTWEQSEDKAEELLGWYCSITHWTPLPQLPSN